MDRSEVVKWFLVSLTTLLLISCAGIFLWLVKKQKKNFWHHGVRLPSRPQRVHWYLVTISVGCRPWAGHEGDVYIRLIGTEYESNTFLANGEVHSRLAEADSHQVLCSTPFLLGDIRYVIVVCSPSSRAKRWYLSSVNVKHVSDADDDQVWYFPYHEWVEVFLEPVKVTLSGVNPEHDFNSRLMLGWLSRGVSDFHLWTSLLTPLKYTRFFRAERFLCVSGHVITSTAACILLNALIPNMGPVVLGVYSSSGACIPTYLAEYIFRRKERDPKVVMEDLRWYSDRPLKLTAQYNAEYEAHNFPHGRTRRLTGITCPRFDDDEDTRLQEFLHYSNIIASDRTFWKWLAGAHLDMIEELSAIFSEVSLKGTEEVPPSQITKAIRERRSTFGSEARDSDIFSQKRRRSSLARRMLDADMDSDLPEPYSGMMISEQKGSRKATLTSEFSDDTGFQTAVEDFWRRDSGASKYSTLVEETAATEESEGLGTWITSLVGGNAKSRKGSRRGTLDSVITDKEALLAKSRSTRRPSRDKERLPRDRRQCRRGTKTSEVSDDDFYSVSETPLSKSFFSHLGTFLSRCALLFCKLITCCWCCEDSESGRSDDEDDDFLSAVDKTSRRGTVSDGKGSRRGTFDAASRRGSREEDERKSLFQELVTAVGKFEDDLGGWQDAETEEDESRRGSAARTNAGRRRSIDDKATSKREPVDHRRGSTLDQAAEEGAIRRGAVEDEDIGRQEAVSDEKARQRSASDYGGVSPRRAESDGTSRKSAAEGVPPNRITTGEVRVSRRGTASQEKLFRKVSIPEERASRRGIVDSETLRKSTEAAERTTRKSAISDENLRKSSFDGDRTNRRATVGSARTTSENTDGNLGRRRSLPIEKVSPEASAAQAKEKSTDDETSGKSAFELEMKRRTALPGGTFSRNRFTPNESAKKRATLTDESGSKRGTWTGGSSKSASQTDLDLRKDTLRRESQMAKEPLSEEKSWSGSVTSDSYGKRSFPGGMPNRLASSRYGNDSRLESVTNDTSARGSYTDDTRQTGFATDESGGNFVTSTDERSGKSSAAANQTGRKTGPLRSKNGSQGGSVTSQRGSVGSQFDRRPSVDKSNARRESGASRLTGMEFPEVSDEEYLQKFSNQKRRVTLDSRITDIQQELEAAEERRRSSGSSGKKLPETESQNPRKSSLVLQKSGRSLVLPVDQDRKRSSALRFADVENQSTGNRKATVTSEVIPDDEMQSEENYKKGPGFGQRIKNAFTMMMHALFGLCRRSPPSEHDVEVKDSPTSAMVSETVVAVEREAPLAASPLPSPEFDVDSIADGLADDPEVLDLLEDDGLIGLPFDPDTFSNRVSLDLIKPTLPSDPFLAQQFTSVTVQLDDGTFVVAPTSVWEVDSELSISSLNLNQIEFGNFSTIESMPLADFNMLKHRNKEGLLGDEKHPHRAEDGIKELMRKGLVLKVAPVGIPYILNELTREECELVSMVYFDLVTGAHQWTKPDYPDFVYFREEKEVEPLTAWLDHDIPPQDDGLGNKDPIFTFKGGVSDDVIRDTNENLEVRQKYPEPIPRKRLFSMVMFPDVVDRLNEAYREMLADPEKHSALSEVFCTLADSKDAALHFAQSCVLLARTDEGRKTYRNIIALGRKSPAWTSIICDVTQRLRFQGDNVLRIREKYGFQPKCERLGGVRVHPCDEYIVRNLIPGNPVTRKDLHDGNCDCGEGKVLQSEECVFYELERIDFWNKKVLALGIPSKDCPLAQLPAEELKRLSRFYRHMLMTQDGAVLFGELLIQAVASGPTERSNITRMIRIAVGHDQGVGLMVDLHHHLSTSHDGRRILTRIYRDIKEQQPYGRKLLIRLADYVAEVPRGSLLIPEVQRLGLKAHKIARVIRNDIRDQLEPLVESSCLHLRHVILRLNAMARCMLRAVGHAREVLEGIDDKEEVRRILGIPEQAWKAMSENITKPAFDAKKSPWASTPVCCRQRGEWPEEKEVKKPKRTVVKSESFVYSPSESDITCERFRKAPRKDVLVSSLWQPLDQRAKVNIYEKDNQWTEEQLAELAKYCQAQIRMNYNEFFLQTKDYEKFYMNFEYKPRKKKTKEHELSGLLGGQTGAKVQRSESSLLRAAFQKKLRRMGYRGPHSKQMDLFEIAKKWGRKVKNLPSLQRTPAEPTKYPCACRHDPADLGSDSEEPDAHYGCLICTIAREIAEAQSATQVADVITDRCKEIPSDVDFRPVPNLRGISAAGQTLREVPGRRARSFLKPGDYLDPEKWEDAPFDPPEPDRSSKKQSHQAGPGNDASSHNALRAAEEDVDLSSEKESGAGGFIPFPSARCPSETTNSTTSLCCGCEKREECRCKQKMLAEGKAYRDFKGCKVSRRRANELKERKKMEKLKPLMDGTNRAKQPCLCKKGQLNLGKVSSEARMLAMYTQISGDFPGPDLSTSIDPCDCDENAVKRIGRKSRPYPVTAQTVGKKAEINERRKLAEKRNLATIPDSNPEKEEKTPCGGIIRHASPKRGRSREEDLEYWARERREDDEFSSIASSDEYCEECGGVVTLKGGKKPVVTYRYLIKHRKGERQGDKSSAESDWSVPRSDKEEASDPDYEDARICSKHPLCKNMPHGGAKYRHSKKRAKKFREKWFEQENKKMKELTKKAHELWHPPERHILENIQHKIVDECKFARAPVSPKAQKRTASDVAKANRVDKDKEQRISQELPSERHSQQPGRAPPPQQTAQTVEDVVDEKSSLPCHKCVPCESIDLSTSSSSVDCAVRNVDSDDRVINKWCRRPITGRVEYRDVLEKFLNDTCELHKVPKFECCRLHHEKWSRFGEHQNRDPDRLYAHVPLECVCHFRDSMSGDFHSALSCQSKPSSVCSECRIHLGTQQQPPCRRYLLPLKAVRCYEEALIRYAGKLPTVTDSGVSVATAYDVIDEDDLSSVGPNQMRALMDLMGLNPRPGTKHRPCRPSPSESFISDAACSSVPSSGVCCHVHKARQIPVLHLQGYGCEPTLDYDVVGDFRPMPLDWWKRHDIVLRMTQSCADECVRAQVLVARNKREATTDHEATCKVCSDCTSDCETSSEADDAFGAIVVGARYSEMLPVMWRPTVREHGAPHGGAQDTKRIRFYRQLIEKAVESTRSVLLAPDLQHPKRPNDEFDDDEPVVTSDNLVKLAQFREIIKALNDLLETVTPLKDSGIVSEDDVKEAATMPFPAEDEVPPNCKKKKMNATLLDAIPRFLSERMGGTVMDCCEVLEDPWRLPYKAQQVAGEFLTKMIDKLDPQEKPEDMSWPLEDAMASCIEECVNDAVRKALTHTCIKRAIQRASQAKQLLHNLSVCSRLCAAKLLRFSEIVEFAIGNTRQVVKRTLEEMRKQKTSHEFTEEWWKTTESTPGHVTSSNSLHEHISAVLESGHDDARSTLDDVLIGFEKLRHHVRADMLVANMQVTSILDLRDDAALALFEGNLDKRVARESYDAWTESEVTLREELLREEERAKEKAKSRCCLDEDWKTAQTHLSSKSNQGGGINPKDRHYYVYKGGASSRESLKKEVIVDNDNLGHSGPWLRDGAMSRSHSGASDEFGYQNSQRRGRSPDGWSESETDASRRDGLEEARYGTRKSAIDMYREDELQLKRFFAGKSARNISRGSSIGLEKSSSLDSEASRDDEGSPRYRQTARYDGEMRSGGNNEVELHNAENRSQSSGTEKRRSASRRSASNSFQPSDSEMEGVPMRKSFLTGSRSDVLETVQPETHEGRTRSFPAEFSEDERVQSDKPNKNMSQVNVFDGKGSQSRRGRPSDSLQSLSENENTEDRNRASGALPNRDSKPKKSECRKSAVNSVPTSNSEDEYCEDCDCQSDQSQVGALNDDQAEPGKDVVDQSQPDTLDLDKSFAPRISSTPDIDNADAANSKPAKNFVGKVQAFVTDLRESLIRKSTKDSPAVHRKSKPQAKEMRKSGTSASEDEYCEDCDCRTTVSSLDDGVENVEDSGWRKSVLSEVLVSRATLGESSSQRSLDNLPQPLTTKVSTENHDEPGTSSASRSTYNKQSTQSRNSNAAETPFPRSTAGNSQPDHQFYNEFLLGKLENNISSSGSDADKSASGDDTASFSHVPAPEPSSRVKYAREACSVGLQSEDRRTDAVFYACESSSNETNELYTNCNQSTKIKPAFLQRKSSGHRVTFALSSASDGAPDPSDAVQTKSLRAVKVSPDGTESHSTTLPAHSESDKPITKKHNYVITVDSKTSDNKLVKKMWKSGKNVQGLENPPLFFQGTSREYCVKPTRVAGSDDSRGPSGKKRKPRFHTSEVGVDCLTSPDDVDAKSPRSKKPKKTESGRALSESGKDDDVPQMRQHDIFANVAPVPSANSRRESRRSLKAKELYQGKVDDAAKEEAQREQLWRKALKARKGTKILQDEFGLQLRPCQMITAFHRNVHVLLAQQEDGFAKWVGYATQATLWTFCLISVIYCWYFAFAVGAYDHALLAAVPVAVLAFGFVLEPLKCIVIAWLLLIERRRPAFSGDPLYIQSNPVLFKRLSALRPSKAHRRKPDSWMMPDTMTTASDYEQALYYKYCENKRRPEMHRQRRRKLPALAESNVSLSEFAARQAKDLDQAWPKSSRLGRASTSSVWEQGFHSGLADGGPDRVSRRSTLHAFYAPVADVASNRGSTRSTVRAYYAPVHKVTTPKRISRRHTHPGVVPNTSTPRKSHASGNKGAVVKKAPHSTTPSRRSKESFVSKRGHRRAGHDFGKTKRKRHCVQPPEVRECSSSESYSDPPRPGRTTGTRIVWCKSATAEDGRPPNL